MNWLKIIGEVAVTVVVMLVILSTVAGYIVKTVAEGEHRDIRQYCENCGARRKLDEDGYCGRCKEAKGK